MAELFNITHEGGNLNEWNTITEDNGEILVSNASAMAGTNYGLEVVMNSSTVFMESIKVFDTPTNIFRFRYYFNHSGLSMSEGDVFNTMNFDCPALGSGTKIAQGRALLKSLSSILYLKPALRSDANAWSEAADIALSGKSHLLEFLVNRATSNVASDATMQIFMDGVSIETISGVDLFDDWPPQQLRVGAVAGLDTGTSGSIFFDEIKANDDGSLIGPVTFPGGRRSRYSGADYGSGYREKNKYRGARS